VIDIGISKLVIIGAIALVVIGPDKLPALAKTIGTLLGRARRYVADVKEEVNRSMELDEFRKMKDTVEGAARDVEKSMQTSANDFEKSWAESIGEGTTNASSDSYTGFPEYKHPRKKWRVKQGATPNWYKARTGTRTRAMSGAARVARYRPAKIN
jgi:sec-independent protein translocase protein TatB